MHRATSVNYSGVAGGTGHGLSPAVNRKNAAVKPTTEKFTSGEINRLLFAWPRLPITKESNRDRNESFTLPMYSVLSSLISFLSGDCLQT